GCATSVPGSKPGSPASNASMAPHVALGAGSIISRPTSGPPRGPTIWCCSPASNWHSRFGFAQWQQPPTQPDRSYSQRESVACCCYQNTKAQRGPTQPLCPWPCYVAENAPLWTGTSWSGDPPPVRTPRRSRHSSRLCEYQDFREIS